MGEARVAIVGSGFGGLAAGIRLQAAGVRTVLYEARDRAGGRAYVYQDQGFTFDAGPTVITAPHCLEELFTLAGERMADHVTLDPVRPFYRLRWADGTRFDYGGDSESMRAEMAALAPGDARATTGSWTTAAACSRPAMRGWSTPLSCASSTWCGSRPSWRGCAPIVRSTAPSAGS